MLLCESLLQQGTRISYRGGNKVVNGIVSSARLMRVCWLIMKTQEKYWNNHNRQNISLEESARYRLYGIITFQRAKIKREASLLHRDILKSISKMITDNSLGVKLIQEEIFPRFKKKFTLN